MIPVATCYQIRFSRLQILARQQLWHVLVSEVFARYVPKHAVVMDIGAGYCELINAITARKKYAVDINPDTRRFAGKNVTVMQQDALTIPKRFNGTIDRIFLSNFLEHLDTKEGVFAVLTRTHQLLRPGGKLLIVQPNIDLVKERYWDFFDHKVVLNSRSLQEGLILAGFTIERFTKRFLPYTTKSLLPKSAALVRLYLLIPSYLRPFAGQSFVVARKY